MSNNPFNVINPANPMNANRIGEMKSMYQAFRNSNNPMALFQQMAMRNPQMQQIYNMLRNGANPNQLFENVCKQKGIDPNQLRNMLKG